MSTKPRWVLRSSLGGQRRRERIGVCGRIWSDDFPWFERHSDRIGLHGASKPFRHGELSAGRTDLLRRQHRLHFVRQTLGHPSSITNGQFLKGNTGTDPDTLVFGTVSMGDLDEAKSGFLVPAAAGRYLQTDGTTGDFEFDVIPVADLSDGPGARRLQVLKAEVHPSRCNRRHS